MGEALTGEKTPGQIARQYGVHPNSVALWKKTFLERGAELFAEDKTVREYERRIAELEQLLGKKEVEIALLKTSWAGQDEHGAEGGRGAGGAGRACSLVRSGSLGVAPVDVVLPPEPSGELHREVCPSAGAAGDHRQGTSGVRLPAHHRRAERGIRV